MNPISACRIANRPRWEWIVRRQLAGRTIKEAAWRLGVSPRTLSRWMTELDHLDDDDGDGEHLRRGHWNDGVHT